MNPSLASILMFGYFASNALTSASKLARFTASVAGGMPLTVMVTGPLGVSGSSPAQAAPSSVVPATSATARDLPNMRRFMGFRSLLYAHGTGHDQRAGC